MAETLALNNNILKELLSDAMVYRGKCTVLEEAVTPGIYLLEGDTTTSETNPPAGWNVSLLEVMKRNADIIQRITRIDGDYMLIRVKRSGAWKPFRKIVLPTL